MTKIEEFTRDEANREELRKALPILLKAIEAVEDSLIASHINEGLASPGVGNAYYQQVVGAKYIRTTVPELVNPIKKVTPPLGRRQYTEADREELKRRHEQK